MPEETGPPFLGDASPELAAAYVQAAHDAKTKGKGARSLSVDRYRLTVGVRRLSEEERDRRDYRFLHRDFQVVTRVDVLAAERLGLEVDRKKLDLWVSRQERGLDCLFWAWNGYKAPFPADRFSLELDVGVNPESSWATWIVEKGRFRLSAWTIGPSFETLFGARRKKKKKEK